MLKALNRWVILVVVLVLVPLVGIAWPAAPADAQTDEICFDETGFCISGPIRQFWEANGGLPVFGLPLSPQQEAYIGLLTPTPVEGFVSGTRVQAQQFERNRLELHSDGSVRIGRLGADILAQQGRDWFFEFERSGPQPGCQYFESTGHNICGAMLETWNQYGGLDLVGLPLSGPHEEMLEDGNIYVVQWFERARFQITPGVGVQLGRLGALDICANVPAPVNADLSPSNCLIRNVPSDARVYGFPPNSEVRTWGVLADGLVLTPDELNYNFMVDENGSATVPIGVISRELGNQLYFIFQGVDNSVSVLYLNIIDPELTPFATSVFHPCLNLPPAANGVSAPIDENRQVIGDATACAAPGVEALGVLTGGFAPGEQVDLILTAPNGDTFPSTLVADGEGLALNAEGQLPRFLINNYRQSPGLYIFFFVGTQSGNVAAVPIMVSNVPLPDIPLTPQPEADSTLNIVNESGETICYVNFSFVTDEFWGPDRLGATEVIGPGGTRAFQVPSGDYDVRLLNCDQQTLLEEYGIGVYGYYELRFTGAGAAGLLPAEVNLSRKAN